MKLYQRVLLVLAHEGISGASRRVVRRVQAAVRSGNTASGGVAPSQAAADGYAQLRADFSKKALAMGYGDLSRHYWYHTIDLGNGLVTPGNYDYRPVLASFGFPSDMTGMQVLDVGSATGFFAFEFEKRGARVTSVELPSMAAWDLPSQIEKEERITALLDYFGVGTLDEAQHFGADGPFEFCRTALRSKVKRCHSTIYELSPQKLGVEGFDLIFVGDVLLHLLSPFQALGALAPLCKGTLVIAQEMPDESDKPVMDYVGGEERGIDAYWIPNKACLEQMLKRLGFQSMSVIGYHTGINRQDGWTYRRAIIHARK